MTISRLRSMSTPKVGFVWRGTHTDNALPNAAYHTCTTATGSVSLQSPPDAKEEEHPM